MSSSWPEAGHAGQTPNPDQHPSERKLFEGLPEAHSEHVLPGNSVCSDRRPGAALEMHLCIRHGGRAPEK